MKQSLLQDIAVALLAPSLVLGAQIIRVFVYPGELQIDMVAHFVGGASIAFGAWILLKRLEARHLMSSVEPTWFRGYVIIATVFVAGVCWEFFEWSSDLTIGTHNQLSLHDTMWDLLLDSLGGLLVTTLVFLRKKNRRDV